MIARWKNGTPIGLSALLLVVACDGGPEMEGVGDTPVSIGDRAAFTDKAYLSVPLPLGVHPSDLEASSDSVQRLTDAAVAEAFRAARKGSVSDVVVLVDGDGNPVLPDADRARRIRLAAPAANELTFTYNSTAIPWTGSELSDVQGWITACYAEAKPLYGAPAFANTVNIKKAVTGYAGVYNASTNEMSLSPTTGVRSSVVCHEMVHAFRDDYIIGLHAWEEGMTRATEVEISKRAGLLNDMDHTYGYDVFYEALNLPIVGGDIYGDWSQGLLRYQLAGYAFAKAMLEDNAFFASFNASYYAAVTIDPSLAYDAARLTGIAAAVKTTVEDKPFLAWFNAQGVLDTSPPTGDIVYVRSGYAPSATQFGNIFISVFNRDTATGVETNLSGIDVDWTVTDGAGATVKSDSGVTNSAGMVEVALDLADVAGHTGPALITATAEVGGVAITSTGYTTLGSTEGAFGIVTGPGNDSGEMTLTPLDATASPVTVAVTDGTFAAPTLLSVKGRIAGAFRGANGVAPLSFTFTKDDAPYFLHVDTSGAPEAPTGLTAAAGDAEVSLVWTAASGAASYRVWRSTASGSGYVLVGDVVPATNFTVTGLTNGVTYYFVVQAVSADGASANSNEASATPAVPLPCASPIEVSPGRTQIDLGARSGACYKVTNFVIQGWTCWNWSGRTVSVNGGAPTSSCGFAVVPWSDGAYYFDVSAGTYPWAGFGWWGIASPTAPEAPANVTAMPGDAEVGLSWSASPRATSYRVLRSTVDGGGYALIADGIAATSYVDTGLTNGTTYYYVISAVNPGGVSPQSEQVSAVPGALTAPCASPITVPPWTSSIVLNTSNAVCYKITREIRGWNCTSWTGRTISVNGGAPSATCGFPITPWFDGAYYFAASAGTYSWAAVNLW